MRLHEACRTPTEVGAVFFFNTKSRTTPTASVCVPSSKDNPSNTCALGQVGGGSVKLGTVPTASVCVSRFKDRNSSTCVLGREGGGQQREQRAVIMGTNLLERWLFCSQELHVLDYNVPPIVSAAFLKF